MSDYGLILDLINKEDEVLQSLPSREVHEKGLLHRAMHILIVNSKGQIFVRQRSLQKELYPGVWSTSVGEHVASGASYDETAERALKEFLGLECELTLLGKIRVKDEIENELMAVYLGRADDIPHISSKHMEGGEFLSEERIQALLRQGKATSHLKEAVELMKSRDS
ncbi:NUDIX domain-containing protein [Patescibacteria group bacterium]|nr:NUDIX domain-containing protein [Patescibacteria group bacterium]